MCISRALGVPSRASFLPPNLYSHLGLHAKKAPLLGLMLWCQHLEIFNNVIFDLGFRQSRTEPVHEQRRDSGDSVCPL